MSRWRVRAAVLTEDGTVNEIPLDEAPAATIRLASVLHGRDISVADYYAIMQGFPDIDTWKHSL